ncbi:uncharacterized protein LACBIDRAFT_298114 [Laccaria bicolor S238N-H82]|uniref:Predicted protein n=1 Tax=Laccaria bicolor (strain S238N-H82 / ATCC MYA-4686) TaxID=486041 RepID=B0DCA1_LACBS|nr:uncharacterized protein LACBIDRAFT_298114 [Laccaria bicolor S238N-H82]EDR07861.1 predicted protein [Laccaria bicolor S238N-H82]|eukprot:XP_001881650.1 predicted protein [Laccaria bicolor S238N-H82]
MNVSRLRTEHILFSLMTTRSPYTNGVSRKLVLAFDVGTTYSGISYSILDPGLVPEILGVTRFPAQEQVGGDSKIPTIIYYDQAGSVCATGAEAVREGIDDMAEDGQWIKAEWFKLHLRPKTQSALHVSNKIPLLPRNKTAVDVFADFLRYLYQCTRTYIQDTHAFGNELWRSLSATADFVLTHPNGWEGAQQSQMRKAAVMAGLISDTEDGHARLSFVTEGEASLHFCVQSGLTASVMKEEKGVLIIDAGGGTIDISAYRRTSPATSQSFEEIAAPQCHFHGSIFVTNRASDFLKELLKNSKFSDDIQHITRCFDKTTKLRFRDVNEPQYIKFGSARDKDLKLNIRSGQLKILGSDVASFFDPSVQCILKAVEEQRNASHDDISCIFLVGGFAASDWLFSRLKNALEPRGLSVCRPDRHVNKAVADGAISFYLDHFVSARVSKFSYGITCATVFDPSDIEHIRRSSSMYFALSGIPRISGAFSCILPKNVKVSETKEFRESYLRMAFDKHTLKSVSVEILCFRGQRENPRWMDVDPEMYSTLCAVQADTSLLSASLKPQWTRLEEVIGLPRSQYYKMEFDIILSFGLTELKAQVCWEENGVEKRSAAKIVYDPVPLCRATESELGGGAG